MGNKKKGNKKKRVKKATIKEKEDNHLGIKMLADITEVELLREKGDDKKANAMLQNMSETYEGLWKTEIALYSNQLKIVENTDENLKSALSFLEQMQQTNTTFQYRPAIIATLISMYHDLNRTKDASNLLASFSKDSVSDQELSKKALGQYYFQLGMYKESIDIFEEILESEEGNEEEKNECLALLVIALSYVDEEAA